MKKFFTFLLYLFIILLIAGVVFGIGLLLQRPLQESAIATAVILGIWLLIVVIKKLIIRQRAKAQVERILQKEDAMVDARLGKSQKELMKDLRKTWNGAVKVPAGSSLSPGCPVLGEPVQGAPAGSETLAEFVVLA